MLRAAALAAVAMALVACQGDPARSEAASLVRLVTDLRAAPNQAKRGPLDRLQQLNCSFQDVCEARRACLEAFQHHVRGVELGASLHGNLDASVPEPAGSTNLVMRLLEMNLEIEEGNKLMPACEEKLTAVRITHKV